MSFQRISDLNRFFEPNLFKTAGMPTTESQSTSTSRSETPIIIPDLSSSPTSSAPSSPRSSRSTLSLGDPEIKKIWDDPRFRPVVQRRTHPKLNTSTLAASPFREEYNTPLLLNGALGVPEPFAPSGPLNPLAQPFVPCFAVQDVLHPINADPFSAFYGDNAYLLRGGLHGALDSTYVEESSIYPPVYFPNHIYATPGCEVVPRPPYPPGLFYPQNAITASPLGEQYASAVLPWPPTYSSVLIEALLPTLDNSAREALVQTVFNHISRWDLFSLRELTSTLMAAAFGNEHELVRPCTEKECADHATESIEMEESFGQEAIVSREDAFHQVVNDFATILCQNSGQAFADMFVMQVVDAVFGRFTSAFDSNNPESLSAYYTTHQVSPCISYIRASFSLCKAIAFLYQQSIVQSLVVNQCIAQLLQDLMSVEHLEALRLIVIGSGMNLWNPPLSTLSVHDEGVEGGSASPFTFPPIKEQAKAKLCGDITMFCSKLDGYKIRRGQKGCISLRGQDWNLSGEAYKARIKDFTDNVREWEGELVKLIEERGPNN